MIDPHIVVDFMNELQALDPEAVETLIETRVPCNYALAGHPTLQCVPLGGGHSVGLLGILNGLCGVDRTGAGFIVAEFDDPPSGKLTRFYVRADA